MTLTELKAWITANIFMSNNRLNSATSVRELLYKVSEETYGRASEMETYAQGLMTDYPNRFSKLDATFLYVNQVTGNDANPGTSGLPVQTLQRASAILNNKFCRAYVVILSDYELTTDADFDLASLSLYCEGNFVAKKRTFAAGEGTSFIRNLGGGIYFSIVSAKTLTLEAHTGPAVGFTSVSYDYALNQGFLRAGLADYSYIPKSRIFIYAANVVLGNNTVLFGSYFGATGYTYLEVCTTLELFGAQSLTLGTNAYLGKQLSEFEFRKSVLPTTGTWVDILAGTEAILATGAYVVQVSAKTYTSGGAQYDMLWTGMMGWHSGATNGVNDTCEIPLHYVGHARGGAILKLRTIMTSDSAKNAKLQMESTTLTSASVFIFKFKKLI